MNTEEIQKLKKDEVHADTDLRGNKAFIRLKIKYHKLVFYPSHNGNWITHSRPLTLIDKRYTPHVTKRWNSLLRGLFLL